MLCSQNSLLIIWLKKISNVSSLGKSNRLHTCHSYLLQILSSQLLLLQASFPRWCQSNYHTLLQGGENPTKFLLSTLNFSNYSKVTLLAISFLPNLLSLSSFTLFRWCYLDWTWFSRRYFLWESIVRFIYELAIYFLHLRCFVNLREISRVIMHR